MQPTASFACSADNKCSKTDVTNTYSTMLDDQGKCSALLTREGFFDFVVFRTHCNEPHSVAIVCQNDKKVNFVFNNNMSDIKISINDGFYSLQVSSSCDVGWFMVDGICINTYRCPQDSSGKHDCETVAQQEELCQKHHSELAYRIFNNMSFISSGNTLDNNTELSLFWGMFVQREDISAHMEEAYWETLCEFPDFSDHEEFMHTQRHFGINNSTLCALNRSDLCDRVLSITYYHEIHSYRQITYRVHGTDFEPLWSVINQPHFSKLPYWKKTEIDMSLCEKSVLHHEMFTNCSIWYMTCSDGTCVHDSLVCDGHPHCMYGEDEDDCQHICSDHRISCMSHCYHIDLCSCAPNYFQCLSGECVPLQKLCDKIVHCADASDEPATCVYMRPEQLGNLTLTLHVNNYINNIIQENSGIQQECSCHNNSRLLPVEYIMHGHQPNCTPSSLSDVKFLCSVCDMPYGPLHYFSLDRLCIYDHDCDDNYINHCLNGFHLLKCKHMYCIGRFKCPSSYCISFDHICNKVCDCPHCEDENICNKLLCPGMVLTEQMGSGLRCSKNVAELNKLNMNMRQVIRRKDLNLTDEFPVFVHLEDVVDLIHFIHAPEIVVYCKILHSKFTINDYRVLQYMVSIRRLLLPHNSIQKLYDATLAAMSQLIILDLSHNFIIICPFSYYVPCAISSISPCITT